MRRALILGASGQDGSYMCEYLLSLNYRVTGFARHKSEWLKDAAEHIEFIYGDLRDAMSLEAAVRKSWPDEIYNFAAQVFVPESWTLPSETLDVNVGGVARLLQIVDRVKPNTRVYQASTSEMFGNHEGACNEETPFIPVSPYGVSKLAAHNLVHVYRHKGLFVVSGVCGNHESPRRGLEMVTRKIARAVAEWACGGEDILPIGNLHSMRDWGFAGDYVKAMHLMLQQPEPTDYIIGTGSAHSVVEYIREACIAANVSLDVLDARVQMDKSLVRKNEIGYLKMDPRRILAELGWCPETHFISLVQMMVDAELVRLKNVPYPAEAL